MQFSVLAACLVLFVAVCDVSAQWGDSNPRFGVSLVEHCICNDGDWCEQRANGLYMCRIPNGRYYAPIKAGVQGLLRGQVQLQGQVPLQGQVQGLRADCCQSNDYLMCTTGQLTNSYIGGRTCLKFYFDQQLQRCMQIEVNSQCVKDFNPSGIFEDLHACNAKCGAVAGQKYVNQPIAADYVPVQPIVARKTVVRQEYDNRPIISRVHQPIVAMKTVSRQRFANQPIIAGAGLAGRRAACCQSTDYLRCTTGGLTGAHSYGVRTCNKFYFDQQFQRCMPIEVNSQCVKALNPSGIFEDLHACNAKCSSGY